MSEQGDKNKQLSPTICMLPVSSIAIHATGKMIRCHMSETEMGDVNSGSIIKQWDNNAFQDLRKAQRDGEWTQGCQNCQSKEARNVTSKRVHWQNLDVIDDRWGDIDWDNNLTGNKLVHLDIAFNNLCNFKCRMCSSAYSNAWIGDEEKLKQRGFASGGAGSPYVRTSSMFDRTKHTLSTEQLQELVDNGKDLRRVEILGGEPFLVPQFMEFLGMLRKAGLDKQIELMITTNGSVITEDHLEKVKDITEKIISKINELKYFNNITYSDIWSYSFNKYTEGDFLNWHTDSHEMENGATLTIVMELSDDFEGGEFCYGVNNEEHKLKKGKGNMYIFPSDTKHRVTKLTSGVRYSFNAWPRKQKSKGLI
jgi:radical SAM protein with 4Fe4S-binding SPASM domain